MEDSQLERYKLATLEVLESLGGIADTRHLADSVFLSLDDVPPEDLDYDYAGLSRNLRLARESLLKEGNVTLTDGRIWRLARPQRAPTAESFQPDLGEDEFWDRLTIEQFFAGYSEEDALYDTI